MTVAAVVGVGANPGEENSPSSVIAGLADVSQDHHQGTSAVATSVVDAAVRTAEATLRHDEQTQPAAATTSDAAKTESFAEADANVSTAGREDEVSLTERSSGTFPSPRNAGADLQESFLAAVGNTMSHTVRVGAIGVRVLVVVVRLHISRLVILFKDWRALLLCIARSSGWIGQCYIVGHFRRLLPVWSVHG